jgi:hypothetical protein
VEDIKMDHGSEPWGFIKGGQFLDHLSDSSFSRRTVIRGINYHTLKIFV